ncbi:MAG: fatty acyl-AMP ligase [Commensalibacter sp.]|nr:fatty acyl-AMP ligase [Commensalibacter sp.]
MALIIPKDSDREDWAAYYYNVVDWHTSTLTEMLQHRARVDPFHVVYRLLGDGIHETDSITTEELHERASTIAAGLHRFGKIGDRVLLLCENDLNYIIAFFGCIYAGMIPASGVHVDVLHSDERFEMLAQDSKPHMIIGPRKILVEYQKNNKNVDRNIIWVPLEVIFTSKEKIAIRGNNEDVAFIQYTSGSTRATRGVLLTHRNLLYNLRHQARLYEFRKGDVGLTWLPFSHDMGLIGGALMTIASGGACILLPPKYFAEKPIRWLEAIGRYKIDLTGGPSFAYELCERNITDEEMKHLDLSALDIAFNGADTASADMMRRFSKKFEKVGFQARKFLFGYGLAEATLVVTRGKRGISPKLRSFSRSALMNGFAWPSTNELDRRVLISCGTGLEEQKIIIVDPQSCEVLRDGRVGEIWISGSSVAKGYFNRPEETEEIFHAKTADGMGPFLRTGDLGFKLGEQLFFSGRISNVIILRGKAYDPDDISDSLVSGCSDIRVNATAIFLEDQNDLSTITILVEVVNNPKQSHEEIAAFIYKVVTTVYEIWPKSIILLRRGGILKTPSGKIQIAKTRSALKDNALPILQRFVYDVPELPPPLTKEEACVKVEKWLTEYTKDWDVNVRMLTRERLMNGEIDSEQLLKMRRDFEKHFFVLIDPSEYVTACQTWDDLCNLLATQISVRSSDSNQ